jgi:hypothetical protein
MTIIPRQTTAPKLPLKQPSPSIAFEAVIDSVHILTGIIDIPPLVISS